jgi:putative flippase GtrA
MPNVLSNTKTAGEFLRFLAVGASNLILTYLVYLGGLRFVPPVASILIAVVVGLVYMALLNIRVVFKRDIHVVVLIATIVYYVFYGLAYAALLDLAIRRFSVPAQLAPLPILCVVLPIHFLISRLIILRLSTGCRYAAK